MYRKYPKPKYVWHWEEIALILFTMTLPMQNLGIFGDLTLAKVFAMVGYAYFMARALLRRDMWIVLLTFKSPTSLAILLFCFVTIASGVNASDTEYYTGFVSRYLSLFNIVIFYAYLMKRKRYLLYALIAGMIVGSFPNAVAGIYELITKNMVLKGFHQGTMAQQALFGPTTELPGETGARRIIGFDGGPGEHAIHFLVYTGFVAMLPFLARSLWGKIFSCALLLIYLVNILGSGSRTGVVGLALALICFFIFIEMRRKLLVIVLLIAATLVGGYIFDVPWQRLLGRTAAIRTTTNFRVEQFRTSVNMVERHPIIGIGAGNFVPEYPRYQWNYPRHETSWSVTPLHNAILNHLVECGVIGLFTLFLLLSVTYTKLYLIQKHSPDRTLRIIAVCFMTAFTGWCGGLLLYPSLADELGWVIMGMTVGLWNVNRGLEREARAPPGEGAGS